MAVNKIIFFRFPGHVLCIDSLCYSWTRKNVGVNTILRSLNLCPKWRKSSKVSSSNIVKTVVSWILIISSYFYRLLELVEDCGPLPLSLSNDKCKLDVEKTNKTAQFPFCCPIFTCEPGVKLEYPEVEKEVDKKH